MVRRFCSQAWLYYKGRKAAFHLPEFLLCDMGYPVITLVFYCLLAAYGFRTTNLTRWVIGNAFLLCTNACIFGVGTIFAGERRNGRLKSIVVSPCSTLALILAGGVGPVVTAAVTVVFNFAVGGLLFGVDVSGVHLGLAAMTILCAMTAAACFGLLVAVFGMVTPSIHLLLNTVHYVLMIFTGAEFPVSQLHPAGQLLSRLLPLTRSIEAMNLLFSGGEGAFRRLLLEELTLAAVYALLAWAFFRPAERLCRKTGRFELF